MGRLGSLELREKKLGMQRTSGGLTRVIICMNRQKAKNIPNSILNVCVVGVVEIGWFEYL